MRQRLGYQPQCLHHDDGILIRLTDTDEPILDLFAGLTPENVEGLILDELADSALFALRFRQNAARSLLVAARTAGTSGRRCGCNGCAAAICFRSLAVMPDFPIVVETFRECLHDHLDVPRLQQLLADIQAGRVEVVTRRAEAPSPFAAGLLFSFTCAFMYQYDGVEADAGRSRVLDRQLLEQLVAPQSQGHLLDPRAVHQVERRLRGVGQPPRSATEMAEWLRRLGDLTPEELEGPMAAFLEQLQAEGRACRLELPQWSRAGLRRPCAGWPPRMQNSIDRRSDWMALHPPTRSRRQTAGAAILASLSEHARPGRPGGRAGSLSVRAGLGATATGRMGAIRPRGRGVRAGRRDACSGLRAGQPGASAARQPGHLAARGRHLFAAAVRRFSAALAGSCTPRRGAAKATGWRRCWRVCTACRSTRNCGSRPCCRRGCRSISRAGWTNGSPAARASGSARAHRPTTARAGGSPFFSREMLRQLPLPDSTGCAGFERGCRQGTRSSARTRCIVPHGPGRGSGTGSGRRSRRSRRVDAAWAGDERSLRRDPQRRTVGVSRLVRRPHPRRWIAPAG